MATKLIGCTPHPGGPPARCGTVKGPIVIARWLLCACLQQASGSVADHTVLSMSEALDWAFRVQRQLVAARLEVDERVVDTTAAKLWPNPEFDYSVNNLVLGAGNDQERDLRPRFAEQTIQSFGISQAFDVARGRWAKLQHARAGVRLAQCRLQDVLREVAHNVQSAFLATAREEREHALAQEFAQRWQESVQVMAARLKAGDIAQTDLLKIQLEAQRAHNAMLGARKELAQARAALAAHMGLESADVLPAHVRLPERPTASTQPASSQALLASALERRPDLLAAGQAVAQAEAQLVVARREALPEVTVGLAYGRSQFMISGDNPHTLGLSVSVPLPVINRNQVGRAQAHLALAQAQNAQALARIELQRELAEAQAALARAQEGVACFEGGGMLDKAETARAVAHRALARGACSVLEVLEAERTALDVHAEHLAMEHALHQAHVDLAYVTAQEAH